MPAISRRFFIGAFAVLALASPMPAFAASGTPGGGKRLALQGYDPVSYFTEGQPEKGAADFNASFDDAVYWFKSAEHRAMFVADPERYAPQFGAYCAINVSRGHKYEADPEAWTIAEGKLYVFGAKEGVIAFRQQTAKIVNAAAEKWPELHKQP